MKNVEWALYSSGHISTNGKLKIKFMIHFDQIKRLIIEFKN